MEEEKIDWRWIFEKEHQGFESSKPMLDKFDAIVASLKIPPEQKQKLVTIVGQMVDEAHFLGWNTR